MHESEKWKWCHSAMSDPQRPHGLQPTRLLRPWEFPAKSTGVGCQVQMDETSTVPGVMILILVVHVDIIKCNRTFQKRWLKKVNTPYVCAKHDMELSLPPRDLWKQSEYIVIHQSLQTKHCPLGGSWSLYSFVLNPRLPGGRGGSSPPRTTFMKWTPLRFLLLSFFKILFKKPSVQY